MSNKKTPPVITSSLSLDEMITILKQRAESLRSIDVYYYKEPNIRITKVKEILSDIEKKLLFLKG